MGKMQSLHCKTWKMMGEKTWASWIQFVGRGVLYVVSISPGSSVDTSSFPHFQTFKRLTVSVNLRRKPGAGLGLPPWSISIHQPLLYSSSMSTDLLKFNLIFPKVLGCSHLKPALHVCPVIVIRSAISLEEKKESRILYLFNMCLLSI